MADRTAISWTDATWNPVTGCTKVSAGCDNCYAERVTERFKRGPFSEVQFHPDRLYQPSRWQKPRMIFVCSMGDLFHSAVTDVQIGQVFAAMLATPRHTYQVLTKRPNRVRRWWDWYRTKSLAAQIGVAPVEWPAHIWLGTSVESQLYVPRIERIAGIAPVTFVSVEPMLGPVDLIDPLLFGDVQWVIAGGESGPQARPLDPEWVRSLRNLCVELGVPFFFKQAGGPRPGGPALLDGREWREMPQAAPIGAAND